MHKWTDLFKVGIYKLNEKNRNRLYSRGEGVQETPPVEYSNLNDYIASPLNR